MLGRTYEGQNCSVAKSLELIGERWTMLVVREVFLGNRRFDEIAARLDIARNVLTDRLPGSSRKACWRRSATRSARSASSTA